MTAVENFLITGAASAIGSVLSRRLAAESGKTLLLTTRSTGRLVLADRHSRIRLLEGIDLTQDDHLLVLAKAARLAFSGPFTIVHSVGRFWSHQPLVGSPLSLAREFVESHYLTLYGVAHALLPLMIERGGGRILAFSCNSVQHHYPDMAPFTSAKAAVDTLIRCIANEYSGYGIVANSLALATVCTTEVLQTKPLGDADYYLTPEELVDIVLQVITVNSPYLNGNVLRAFKHSPNFYTRSYFDRNPRTIEIMTDRTDVEDR